MAAYIAGDKAAFRELFTRYTPLLQRAMARDLRSTEEANDLVQQTFLHLHRSRLDFEPGRKLKPWVFTIALNLKREFFRRSKRRHETSLEDDRVAEPFEGPRGQERSDAARETARALSSLPAEHREVIELHWFAGLSFPEVAEAVAPRWRRSRCARTAATLRCALAWVTRCPSPTASMTASPPQRVATDGLRANPRCVREG